MKFSNFFSFFKKNDFLSDFLSFLFPVTIIIFLPGPTYVALFILIYILALFYIRKDLSLVFFQMYLLSLVIGEPPLTLEGVLIQDFVYYKAPVLLSIPIKIPLRFIIFCFFTASLLKFDKNIQKLKIKSRNLLYPVLFIQISVLLISLGQIFGGYVVRYKFIFLQVLQIFLVLPVIRYFLTSYVRNSDASTKVKQIFLSFVVFTLCFEGVIAIIQYTLKSSVGINIESQFELSFVSAPETGEFRSVGTLAHPNYLGIFLGMLLPLVFNHLSIGKNIKVVDEIIYKMSLVLGLTALFLSFSRWAWISFLLGMTPIIYIKRRNLIISAKELVKGSLLKLVFTMAILLIISSSVVSRFSKFSTFEGRIEVFNIALNLISKHPLWGVGPGNSVATLIPYRESLETYIYSLKGVHSTPLLIGVENGILVFTFFVLFGLSVLVLTIRFKKRIKDTHLLSYLMAMTVFLIGCLAYPLYIWDPSFEFFFLTSAFFIFYLQQVGPFEKTD